MRRNRIIFAAAFALVALTPSCTLFQKAKVAPTPPPAPAPMVHVTPPKPKVAPPAPPDAPPAEPDLSQAGPALPPEELPPPPRRRPRTRPHEDADAPATEPEPPAAVAPLPQLEQVLTPEQRQAYTEEIERNIANAQKAVAALQGRRLNRDQATYLARVRAFIDQANEARNGDLFRARNLAERASVLAEDLLKSVE